MSGLGTRLQVDERQLASGLGGRPRTVVTALAPTYPQPVQDKNGWEVSTPRRWPQVVKSWQVEDFPGSPVVKTLPSNAVDVGLIPGQEAKIPHASLPKNQNMKQKHYCNKFNKKLLRKF